MIALEVKTSAEAGTRGMSAFKQQFNPDRVLLVGQKGIPWQEFLKINPAELF